MPFPGSTEDEYRAAGRLLRGVVDGTVSRSEFESAWPASRSASLTAARRAARYWFDTSAERQHDFELDEALRADIENMIRPLQAGEALPLSFRLPVQLAAVRDHAVGSALLIIVVAIVGGVLFLVLRAL